jgi:hypothetical protein
MLKRIAAFVALLSLLTASNASALDRTQHLQGLNPPSLWMNMEQRDVRIGLGAFLWNAMGLSSTTWGGTYANLSVQPVTGLYVAVGPVATNTVGAVY